MQKPRNRVAKAFLQSQAVLPDTLVNMEQELSWHQHLKKVTIAGRIDAIRALVEKAHTLWKRGIPFEGESAATDRIRLYSYIQGASMAAQSVAKKWKIDAGVAEGNDIAAVEAVIDDIIAHADGEMKTSWQETRAHFSAMFDDQNDEKNLMAIIKHARHLRKSHQGFSVLELWLKRSRESAQAPDSIRADHDEADQRHAADIEEKYIFTEGAERPARDDADQVQRDPLTGKPYEID